MYQKKKTNIIRYLTLFLLLNLIYTKLSACDCILYPITSYIDTTDYIFTFNVSEVNETETERKTKGVLQVVLKGNIVSKETVEFVSDLSNCSVSFKKKLSYLIFCHKVNGRFMVNSCTESGLLSSSRKNIRKIKKYLKKHKKILR